jgi:branched-chain amino acid transport system substrate-binding protein
MRVHRAILVVLGTLIACAPPPAVLLPPAPAPDFRQAEDALARGDYQVAAAEFRRYLDVSPQEPYLPRAYYELALAQHRLHQDEAALATLVEMQERLPGKRWVQVDALRGDAELALGRRVAALSAWDEAWPLASPAEQTLLRDRIAPLAPQLTDDERSEANQIVATAAVREILNLDEAAGSPAPEEAEAVASEATGEAAEEPATVAAAEPGPRAVAPEGAESGQVEPVTAVAVAAPATEPVPAAAPAPPARVACLLPLTGLDHAYGQRALAGLRLAFADAPDQLAVRDTGGDAAVTAELMAALSADPNVLAVIGPLRSSDAEAAAPIAERSQVPMLLLSQREGLGGRFVMQAAMTRSQQVQLLTRYAVATLGLRTLAVIHPDDGYGSSFAKAFSDAASHEGAAVVGSAAYTPGAPDLAAIGPIVTRWRAAGVQAVFIPDAAATAVSVAAAVRAAAPDLALLGTESWNQPDALANAGDTINGAVFADAFFAGSTRASTREFVERFERGAGRPPTVFEAQAFDAAMAVRRAIELGANTRDQVIAQLGALGSFEGAGQLRSSPSGFQRELSLLRYRDGKVEEVSPGTGG